MSVSFLIDISKLNCLDDLKSNDREAMSHQQHALRQISVDENGEIVVRKKIQRMTMKMDVFTNINMSLRLKCKKYNHRIYTLYRDMGNTYLHRYAPVHFQIDINYKCNATSHENRKKFRLKMMSSTIECLKISASSKKPKSAYIDIMGKVEKTSPSELPKNYNQTSYARNLEKKSLNLFQILEMIYCKPFISVKKVRRGACEKSRVHQKEL